MDSALEKNRRVEKESGCGKFVSLQKEIGQWWLVGEVRSRFFVLKLGKNKSMFDAESKLVIGVRKLYVKDYHKYFRLCGP